MVQYTHHTACHVRKDILMMSLHAQVAHIPSALSQCDYLGVLFMNKGINPKSFKFILGKPFGAQVYYSLFARCGWSDNNLTKYGSMDPEWRYIIQKEHPLVTYIDESMGNSLGVACGIAFAGKQVFVNMSDASFQEGTVWESILFAGANKLSNLVVAIDYNKMQALGSTDDICTLAPLELKIRHFGWNTVIVNGHDIAEMNEKIPDFKGDVSDRPTALIFNTVKGKGVSFMEGHEEWHYRLISEDEYNKALIELYNEKVG